VDAELGHAALKGGALEAEDFAGAQQAWEGAAA